MKDEGKEKDWKKDRITGSEEQGYLFITSLGRQPTSTGGQKSINDMDDTGTSIMQMERQEF